MIVPAGPVRVMVALKPVDFRKGMDGLAAHAWRHTFKTRALVTGIDSVVADFICGHAAKTVGDSYYALEGDAGWPALTRAIDAFPRYAF